VVSQLNVGVYYAKGWGVKIDAEKAMEWMKKSADQGYADAQAYLEKMKQVMEKVKAEEKAAASGSKHCTQCGQAIQEGAKFCGSCGAKVDQVEREEEKEKSGGNDMGNDFQARIDNADILTIGPLALEMLQEGEDIGEVLEKASMMAGSWQEAMSEFKRMESEKNYNSEEDYINKTVGYMLVGIEKAIGDGDQDGVEAWVCSVGRNEDIETGSEFFANVDGIADGTFYFLMTFYEIDFDDEDLKNPDETTDWEAVADYIFRANA
jgi:predicted nucleic acid-binding Zn ribbon protein